MKSRIRWWRPTVDVSQTTEAAALERLRADPAVEFAVPDRVRHAHATPNDPGFTGQWYLRSAEASAVNATAAWDRELGSVGVVVAVLDTGVTYDHPDLGRGDLGGRLLPGFDFVSSTLRGNDGDGRDADPSDPGDWVNDADKTDPTFTNCDVTGSSWHGTRVAGMIGAMTNNSAGVSGLSWNSFILPVRVLGKCGGTDSDILAGMRWAAGLSTPGAPANPTPARVLNLSLGSTSACEQSYRTVIDELRARKVLVVISAGNEGTIVSSPANCPGVASVAALRHAGSKVGFSNLGPEVTIGAPGGNCVNINGGPCLFSLDTTSNAGTQASRRSHLYRSDQQQSRYELLGADRFRDRGAHAVEKLEPVGGPAAGASARRCPAVSDDDCRRPGDPSLPCACERPGRAARPMPVYDQHLWCGHGQCREFSRSGGPAGRRGTLAGHYFRGPDRLSERVGQRGCLQPCTDRSCMVRGCPALESACHHRCRQRECERNCARRWIDHSASHRDRQLRPHGYRRRRDHLLDRIDGGSGHRGQRSLYVAGGFRRHPGRTDPSPLEQQLERRCQQQRLGRRRWRWGWGGVARSDGGRRCC